MRYQLRHTGKSYLFITQVAILNSIFSRHTLFNTRLHLEASPTYIVRPISEAIIAIPDN